MGRISTQVGAEPLAAAIADDIRLYAEREIATLERERIMTEALRARIELGPADVELCVRNLGSHPRGLGDRSRSSLNRSTVDVARPRGCPSGMLRRIQFLPLRAFRCSVSASRLPERTTRVCSRKPMAGVTSLEVAEQRSSAKNPFTRSAKSGYAPPLPVDGSAPKWQPGSENS